MGCTGSRNSEDESPLAYILSPPNLSNCAKNSASRYLTEKDEGYLSGGSIRHLSVGDTPRWAALLTPSNDDWIPGMAGDADALGSDVDTASQTIHHTTCYLPKEDQETVIHLPPGPDRIPEVIPDWFRCWPHDSLDYAVVGKTPKIAAKILRRAKTDQDVTWKGDWSNHPEYSKSYPIRPTSEMGYGTPVNASISPDSTTSRCHSKRDPASLTSRETHIEDEKVSCQESFSVCSSPEPMEVFMLNTDFKGTDDTGRLQDEPSLCQPSSLTVEVEDVESKLSLKLKDQAENRDDRSTQNGKLGDQFQWTLSRASIIHPKSLSSPNSDKLKFSVPYSPSSSMDLDESAVLPPIALI